MRSMRSGMDLSLCSFISSSAICNLSDIENLSCTVAVAHCHTWDTFRQAVAWRCPASRQAGSPARLSRGGRTGEGVAQGLGDERNSRAMKALGMHLEVAQDNAYRLAQRGA